METKNIDIAQSQYTYIDSFESICAEVCSISNQTSFKN